MEQHGREWLPRTNLVFTKFQVDLAIQKMAETINEHFGNSEYTVLFVMRGGAFVGVKLAAYLQGAVRFDYCELSRYGEETTGGVHEEVTLPKKIKDKAFLLVDDLSDEGLTITTLKELLERGGAGAVKTAVLGAKEKSKDLVDFYGLDYPDAFLVGCGMDYKGLGRHLDFVLEVEI